MTMLGKKLLCSLLTLMLLLTMAPAALAENTVLQVKFTGMYATKDGDYEAVALSGAFDIYQNGSKLGTLNVVPGGENTIRLQSADSVHLIPVMASIPKEISLSEYGYSISIAENRLNIAPLTVYANAGLFVVEGTQQASYELLDDQGESFMTFDTDEVGYYALERAIPAGLYTLRMTASAGEIREDEEIEILNYTGPESVQVIRAGEEEATVSYITPEPTEAPTFTPVPTEAPTATPAPTAAPTATPVPTEAPTAVPTFTPAPATGTLVVTAVGENVSVAYTITADEAVLAEGTLSAASPLRLADILQGEYVVTLSLPENAALTALNGVATMQRGKVQWGVVVEADQQSIYTVEMVQTGSIEVPVLNVQPLSANVNSASGVVEMSQTDTGLCQAEGLVPGTYTVTIHLPEGRYSCDAATWQLHQNADGTCTAVATQTVSSNERTVLPPVSRITVGTVSGVVSNMNGKAMQNVAVTVYDAQGKACAEAVTDKTGAWQMAGLNYGEYTAIYSSDGDAFTSTSFVLNDASPDAVVAVSAAKPAKLTVRVFEDENNNGVRNNSEGYVKNVEIALVDEKGAVVTTSVTDKNGSATLNAPAGNYTLQVTAPEDYGFAKKGESKGLNSNSMEESAERTQRSDVLTLKEGESLELGVGLQAMATVTGTVWNDLNADGLWQKDEPGIPGVRVTIEGSRNGIFREVVTDENGYYELKQLKKGSYELTCHVPDEYVFTVKAKGDVEEISRMTTEADRAGVDEFSLERGETHDQHNIGMMEGVIIEGVCFLDENYNGYYDEGEKPLPGVEMRLARQSNNVLLQQTVSDENGVYHFYGQRGSTFTIRATLPSGYVFSATAEGENGNRFAPNDKKNERRLTDVTIENGGYMQAMVGAVAFGSISGRVYYDEDFSATWDKGEAVAQGFLITLLDASGNKVLAQKTDKNGNFTFNGLNPGQYTITMNPEKGYAFTALGAGNIMVTQADGSGRSRVIDLAMGEDAANMSIGMIRPAKVSGVVFADANDNGMQDKGEKGLTGTVVRLMSDNGEAASITVEASGEFSFNAVLPGTYYLQYELPQRAVFAPVQSGGNTMSGENGVAVSGRFSVDVEDVYAAPLCGGTLLSGISGVAFADTNGNGAMDEGEPALSGMSITLVPSRDENQVLNAVSGQDGAFAFSNLHPDTYTLTVICPDASVLSRMPYASLGLNHGLNSQSVQLQLEMGLMLTDQLLGCVLPSKWTGEAYLDENYDGMRAANEAPAAGETILLLDADSGETVATVLTDENGQFVIEGIAPGEYELVYLLDEGNLVPKAGDNHLHQEEQVMTTGRVRVKENEDMSGTVISVVRTTEIAGLVWLEEYDGVTPVAGAKVFLLDESATPVAEFTTGQDGRYSFKGLMPGEYSLEVTTAKGYVLVESSDPHLAEAGLISVLDEAEGLHGASGVIDLRMAKHQLTMDIGNVLPGRLGDKVWLDLNENGLQDGDEGGIPGVTIELLRGERVVATTVSDQYGYYVFENLYPTEYTLRVTWPAQIVPTTVRTDVSQIVSVLHENGLSIPVTVESNKANYTADLGFVLVEQGVLPAGYGEGETQVWKKK